MTLHIFQTTEMKVLVSFCSPAAVLPGRDPTVSIRYIKFEERFLSFSSEYFLFLSTNLEFKLYQI
jgi:hypothetical protein